jgi:acetyltransferase-like isoleucine patch superfamily enzyme
MKNNKIYKNVEIGEKAEIGDYVIIGKPPKGKTDGELKTIIGDNAVIRSHTVIYAGNKIGDNFQTGHHVIIRENNNIGNSVSIGSGSDVEYEVEIEDQVRVHSQAFIPEHSILRKGCWIGPNVVLTNARYPGSEGVKSRLNGPELKENVKVGANSTILPAIKVERNSLIGAGSVVTKDVAENIIVAGNPAKKINDLDTFEYYKKSLEDK